MQPENTTGTKKKKTSKGKTSTTSRTDRNKWGTTIRVSWDLYEYIIGQGKFGESFNEVLSRLLKSA